MRLVTLTFLLALLCSLPLAAQETHAVPAEQRQSVVAALSEFLYGASISDAKAHEKFWAPELTYTSSSGTRFGKPQLMNGMRNSQPTPEDEVTAWYTAEAIELKALGPAVILNFTLVSTDVASGERETFLNSGVLVQRDGHWQAINWHATRHADSATTNR
ncbi:nuclear transport factor 2 family protein [Pseudidiomarina insulisalsae]|uniref:Nuclear transport factor 2 family protein n=1 Tax=Pseudidiomarina insulisalsae TaxID=575789 RepID=A0A432YQM5_9GAMM|nr:nuclear transport factor 2 family protein [Pseudidiomarina insulisalsae]RUO63622.1 nuclear transport factor 2 family protein [Pseudidiomarina insulisalsae]